MSLDVARGLLFLPVSTPTNDWYGGDRKGDNLFAESVVALDAKTGKRVWHYQIVHHGLWDYDLPAPPVLATITWHGNTRWAHLRHGRWRRALCPRHARRTGAVAIRVASRSWQFKPRFVPRGQRRAVPRDGDRRRRQFRIGGILTRRRALRRTVAKAPRCYGAPSLRR